MWQDLLTRQGLLGLALVATRRHTYAASLYEPAAQTRAILIAGFHAAGTSPLARSLHFGVSLAAGRRAPATDAEAVAFCVDARRIAGPLSRSQDWQLNYSTRVGCVAVRRHHRRRLRPVQIQVLVAHGKAAKGTTAAPEGRRARWCRGCMLPAGLAPGLMSSDERAQVRLALSLCLLLPSCRAPPTKFGGKFGGKCVLGGGGFMPFWGI